MSESINPPLQSLRITAAEAAALAGVGESTWWRRHSAGETPAECKFGGTTRWVRSEIIAWIEAGCPVRDSWERMRRKAEE